MDKTIGALCKLLNLLYQEAKGWAPQHQGAREKPSDRAQKVWEELSSRYWWSVEERELEKWLSASDELHIDFSQKNKVLYLPPLEKNSEFVPVLSLKCDIGKTKRSIRLRVMLVCSSDGEKLCGIGFRLESPESENQNEGENKKDGRHDFYHAQLIRDFGHKPSVVESPSWLPVTQPSFPLTADCPVTLIFSLLLTLYGKNYCWNFYTKHRQQLGDLKRYMEKLNCWINWGSFT